MSSRIVFLLLLCMLIPRDGEGRANVKTSKPKTSRLDSVCQSLSPNPAYVREFYENNPTYVVETLPPLPWPAATPESEGLNQSTLANGASALEKLPQPLSFLVMRRGKLVFEKYFHGSDASHSNNIHSASKSILAGLIGIAIKQGFIKSVDQKISEILSPKYSFGGTTKKLTVRHLLTMGAGFAWKEDETEYEIEGEDDWAQAILDLPLIDKPGTRFTYNTGLTHLLSVILTQSSGLSTCQFARKYLFEPMNLKFEHWGRDPQGYFSGGYSLYLRPRELMKIGQLYLQKGMWEGKSLVPQDFLKEAWKVSQSNTDSTNKYGFLFWLRSSQKKPVYKMWGYGGQFVYIMPSEDLVMVTTADTTDEFAEIDGDDFFSRYVLSAIED